MNRTSIFLFSFFTTSLCTVLASSTALAANIVVNTPNDDSNAGDGLCTLREAITNANANNDSTTGDCVAGDGVDTITFAGNYTITLAAMLPDIVSSGNTLTITGNGPSNTIIQSAASPGVATYRILKNNGGSVTLEQMTLQNGVEASGGGLNQSGGSLILNYVVLKNNRTTSLRGGGISINGGVVTFNNCTLTGNQTSVATGEGGAIFIGSGTVNLYNSTVSGNSSIARGGGIFANPAGDVFVYYSTITNNVSNSDDLGSDAGGGIASVGNLHVTGSIIAGNKQGTSSPVDDDCTGNGASDGYNLTGSSTGCSFAGTGDTTVDPSTVFSSVLGPLNDNGGVTPSHSLLAGSSAIDAVPNGTNGCGSLYVIDQRGLTRPYNSSCDIGAFELDSSDFPSVTAFSTTSLAADFSVTISSFTATDLTGVTGYLITETSTPPLASDAGWSASAPTVYNFGANGTYSLYPWAKDADGRVSAVYSPVYICPIPDECRALGVWDNAANACTNPAADDGTACDDEDACTQTDSCSSGVCVGSNAISCAAVDQCHEAGVCDPTTGVCSSPSAVDGTACSDSDSCTMGDSCQSGICIAGAGVSCTPSECQESGSCDSISGQCVFVNKTNGTSCTNGGSCLDGICETGGAGGSAGTGGVGGSGGSAGSSGNAGTAGNAGSGGSGATAGSGGAGGMGATGGSAGGSGGTGGSGALGGSGGSGANAGDGGSSGSGADAGAAGSTAGSSGSSGAATGGTAGTAGTVSNGAPSDAEGDGGCACRASSSQSQNESLQITLLGLAVGVLAVRRRRILSGFRPPKPPLYSGAFFLLFLVKNKPLSRRTMRPSGPEAPTSLVFLFQFIGALYSLSYVLGITKKSVASMWAKRLLGAGVFLHIGAMFWRGLLIDFFPLTNKTESFFAAALATAVVLFDNYRASRSWLSLMYLVLGAEMITALRMPQNLAFPPPLMRTIWYPLHVPLSFFAYAYWVCAASDALAWVRLQFSTGPQSSQTLTQDSPASHPTADDSARELVLIDRSALIGFALWSLGMICGGIWGVVAWGTYFMWDPKIIWSVILWFYYATFVHVHLTPSLKDRTWVKPLLALGGLIVVFIAYVGTSFMFGRSSHAF